ncbi:hypothetical protein [Synechococcus elongatus]|uniref:hypothetical protein n=1 Tax=Synechococcus elongatus TaxID=32046 RepID=UPI0012A8A8FD|nr:hypothetical protein EKO22_02515 [Synechococcus elongatus PCC 11802]
MLQKVTGFLGILAPLLLTSSLSAAPPPEAFAIRSTTDLQRLLAGLSRDRDAGARQEIEALMAVLLEKGVPVRYQPNGELGPGQRFVRFGVFSTNGQLTLTDQPLRDTRTLLTTLRHEAWHAVQACATNGRPRGRLRPVGIRTTAAAQQAVIEKGYRPQDHAIEAEAFTAQSVPYQSLEALKEYCP